MATEFKLPELGEGVEAADVVNVLVAKGDTVSKGQTVLEVESDKATVEVPSEVEGEVVELHISPGDTVTVGQLLLTVADGAPTEDSAPQPAPKPASASKSAASRASKSAASSGGGLIPFHVPELGEGVEGADIVSVLVAEGDPIEEGQSVLEVESDKATVEVPSSVAGVVKRLAVKAGETITVGQLVLEVEGSDAAATATPAPEEAPDAPAAGVPRAPGRPGRSRA